MSEAVLSKAEEHLAAGDSAAAERALSAEWRDIKTAPAEAKHAMAMVRAHQKRFADAEQLLRGALTDEPQSLRHNIALGHILTLSENPTKASEAYAAAYRIDPEWPGLLNNYVTACYGAGRYDEAEKGARLMITKAPTAGAWDLLSCSLRGQGRAQEALDAANEALLTNPNHVGALHSQGAALLKLGRASDALKAFDQVEASGGSGAALSFNRAAALEKLGKPKEAKAVLEDAARRWPNAKRPN